MSYWVSLNCAHCERSFYVEPHEEGGTRCVGGSSEACINVTYNYSEHYQRVLDPERGLRWLHGKPAAQTVERLQRAIDQLKGGPVHDYWAPTEGNARHTLVVLLGWAKQHPTAVWSVN